MYTFKLMTRIADNATTRYVAVQYLTKPRTIFYDIHEGRCRHMYGVPGFGGEDDIWTAADGVISSIVGINPATYSLSQITEQEFMSIADSSYIGTMTRLHTTNHSPIETDHRWGNMFKLRYARMTGYPIPPSNDCTLHGRAVVPHAYIRLRRMYTNLTTAIRERNEADYIYCLQALYDEYGSSSMIRRITNGVNDMGWLDDEIILADCGHIERSQNTHEVRSNTWCDGCFEDDAVYVEDRDAYWPRDDAYEHNDGNYYSHEEYDSDDDDDEDEPSRLMGYSTNVLRHVEKDAAIKSSPFGNFLMGVELEMCAGSRRTVDDAVDDVLSQLGNEYCVCKSDGSLPDDGLEIVTAPRGLAEHIDRFKNWNINPSYRAWNSGKCGMHVHIDASAFSQLTLGKFLIFINAEDNKDFIRKIAGRHPAIDNQAQRYCAMEGQTQLANPKTALMGKDSSRYYMVNLANLTSAGAARLGLPDWKFSGKYNTVELRIFRASLKKERLLSQLEFTHAAVMFVRAASYRDLTGAAFVNWLKKYHVLYPHLAAWYGVAPVKKANPNTTPVVSSDETVSA